MQKNAIFLPLLFISFVFSLFFSSVSRADFRVDQINQLFRQYNKRFFNGVYVANPRLALEFTQQQEVLVEEFKKSGGLKLILTLTNDFSTDLIVKLYAFTDDNNFLVGFYYEKSTYFSDNERSFLRFRPFADFVTGVNFIPIDDISFALAVKGLDFKPTESVTLRFEYLTNLKNRSTSFIDMLVQKNGNLWETYISPSQKVSTASIYAWTSIFPPNGGVKQIVFR